MVVNSGVGKGGAAKWIPLADRLLMRAEPITEAGCWIWLGQMSVSGYGQIKDHYRTRSAHRVSYELHVGKIPDGLVVCHRCDVRLCVNPSHLFLGTSDDNNKDKARKGRSHKPRGENHPGHVLTEDAVIAIRASAEPDEVLADRYGVGTPTIRAVKNRRIWKWLP